MIVERWRDLTPREMLDVLFVLVHHRDRAVAWTHIILLSTGRWYRSRPRRR